MDLFGPPGLFGRPQRVRTTAAAHGPHLRSVRTTKVGRGVGAHP
ncbi:hypothetical protein STRTUCAR8_03077 [Streptomyces turgidiscabies Car8]|uniref:Uncharacterized protein n=1 Tax=Streptomyces turgidiscabies (strain Car8) TaxID=698760 RepID=L7F077_STRT8|nr:hypothetical protein STRTUCAR8_03077 [Streptomyces turgidiscabies Car8]